MRTKMTDRQKEKCGRKRGTLCWECRHLDCSWIRSLVPVPGWDAEPDILKFSVKKQVIKKKSYRVKQCPMFEPEGGTRCRIT